MWSPARGSHYVLQASVVSRRHADDHKGPFRSASRTDPQSESTIWKAEYRNHREEMTLFTPFENPYKTIQTVKVSSAPYYC